MVKKLRVKSGEGALVVYQYWVEDAKKKEKKKKKIKEEDKT